MNPKIMRQAGFSEAVNKVNEGKCPFCHKEIPAKLMDEFRDALSVKEYHISGLCQKCQDKTFGGR